MRTAISTARFTEPQRSRRDPEFRFGYFLQPAEEGGCEVGSLAETAARHRGNGAGGFPASAAADGGAFARGLVFLAGADGGVVGGRLV